MADTDKIYTSIAAEKKRAELMKAALDGKQDALTFATEAESVLAAEELT